VPNTVTVKFEHGRDFRINRGAVKPIGGCLPPETTTTTSEPLVTTTTLPDKVWVCHATAVLGELKNGYDLIHVAQPSTQLTTHKAHATTDPKDNPKFGLLYDYLDVNPNDLPGDCGAVIPPPTTSTTSTTSTTVPDETTTTTVDDTTTTVDDTTTTTTGPVAAVPPAAPPAATVTVAPSVPPTTMAVATNLPSTGSENWTLAGIALMMMTGGAGLVLAVRRPDEN
jgi:LPXTG-motif cell wall-anchored protein